MVIKHDQREGLDGEAAVEQADRGDPIGPRGVGHALTDPDADVRWMAASGLQRLSGYVRLPDRSAMAKLILPLTRSNDAESQDVGYVSLRNLLATEPVSDISPALAGLSE